MLPISPDVAAGGGLEMGQEPRLFIGGAWVVPSTSDVIEVNEAFAAPALAVLRALGIPDDADYVNAYGGAIALGHPLGASGARLVTTALNQLARTGRRRAICTMCIGVGQGIALAMERV